MASRLIAATTRCSSQKVIVIVFILAALSLASILSTTKFSNGILWRNSTAKTCNKETANSSDFISMEEDSISNLTNNDVLPKNDSTTIQKPLIAFLHITKTAGSSIEEAGAGAGLNWGKCMFRPSAPLADKKTMCPPMLGKTMKLRTFIQKAPPWHYPVQHLPSSYNPYVGYDLFTVVRNPYTRIISEFYYLKPYLKRKNPDALLGNDPGYMNEWLAKRIKKMKKCSFQKRCFFSSGGHFIPQYKYIYSGCTKSLVKQVAGCIHTSRRNTPRHKQEDCAYPSFYKSLPKTLSEELYDL